MRVSVSGKQFVFPRSCACCGAYPLTSLRVSGSERNRLSRTQGWLWEIPYCVPCRDHVRKTERILVAWLLSVALALFMGLILRVSTGKWSVGVGYSISSAVAVSAFSGWLIILTRRKCSPNCWGLTRAVLYLGSAGTFHAFEVKSKFYASEFIRANHRKIVNASPQVVSILSSTSFGNYQVAHRIIRKSK